MDTAVDPSSARATATNETFAPRVTLVGSRKPRYGGESSVASRRQPSFRTREVRFDRSDPILDRSAVGSKTGGSTAAPIAPFAAGSTMASGGNPVVSSPPPTAPPRGDHRAEVAQSVEHATENRGVASSILALGTIVSAVVARIERKWLSW